MSISDIGKYYSLTDITVTPDQLYLDPFNPRILMDCNWTIDIDDSNICDDSVQESIINIITKNQHHVTSLIDSILSKGFISQGNSIIAKQYDNEKYVVIEGNRRTTAIKHIRSKDSISSDVISTISTLKIKKFDYIENDKYTSEQIIDIILGEIHIDGPVSWGAMEKAHYIYKSYVRELGNIHKTDKFRYESDVAKSICSYFNFKVKDVMKNLMIYRLYDQIRKSGYDIKPEKYSLIEIVINNSDIRQNFFEMNPSYQFSENGIELFNLLCIDMHCIVKNPSDLQKVVKIYCKKPELMDPILDTDMSIDEAYDILNSDLNDNKLCSQLYELVDRIRRLNIGLYQSTDEEVDLIEQTLDLVNNKLAKLLIENKCEIREIDNVVIPNNINEAIDMPESQLNKLILQMLEQRPNHSCVKEKITNYVLNFINVRSNGTPRSEFNRRTLKVLDYLIEEGFVEEYKDKNTRIRLL